MQLILLDNSGNDIKHIGPCKNIAKPVSEQQNTNEISLLTPFLQHMNYSKNILLHNFDFTFEMCDRNTFRIRNHITKN